MASLAADHYSKGSKGGEHRSELEPLVKAALTNQLGVDANSVETDVLSLAGADEFHIGGAAATVHLFEKIGIRDGDVIMDFGSGLGGPARQAAVRYPKSKVIGVDITPKFVEAGKAINTWSKIATQIGDRVALHVGDCTSLDAELFRTASVDKAYSIHVAMNIKDKVAFAKEVARVLRPGGRVGIFEQMANPNPPTAWMSLPCCGRSSATTYNVNSKLQYPLPWARTQEESFCAAPDDYILAFEMAGMRLVPELREDRTNDMLDFFSQMQRKMMWHFASNFTLAPPEFGPAILMGADLTTKLSNYKKAVSNGQLIILELIFEKSL